MAVHPKDHDAENPRMQCAVCKRWMRLHGKRLEVVDGAVTEVAKQRFYGGCGYNNNNDHLAGVKGDNDVCAACCEAECKRIAGCDCQNPTPTKGAAGVSEGFPIHAPHFTVCETRGSR